MRAIFATLLLLMQTGFANQETESQSITAPAFALKNTTGRTQRLADYKGKVVLVNFWATWCVPCQAELPELVKWQKEYRARGLQIVGITFPPESRSRVLRTIRRFKLNYPALFGTDEVVEAYDAADVLPTTIIVDREGHVSGRILGMIEPDEFNQKVAPLLKNAAEENQRN